MGFSRRIAQELVYQTIEGSVQIARESGLPFWVIVQLTAHATAAFLGGGELDGRAHPADRLGEPVSDL